MVRASAFQFFDLPDAVQVGEIQYSQVANQGISSRILKDTIARAHAKRKKVVLSVALKNERAYRLYQRLGFQKVAHNDTHNFMACDAHS
jgi:RimJ/RimL family protein N-acetyltransferase